MPGTFWTPSSFHQSGRSYAQIVSHTLRYICYMLIKKLDAFRIGLNGSTHEHVTEKCERGIIGRFTEGNMTGRLEIFKKPYLFSSRGRAHCTGIVPRAPRLAII